MKQNSATIHKSAHVHERHTGGPQAAKSFAPVPVQRYLGNLGVSAATQSGFAVSQPDAPQEQAAERDASRVLEQAPAGGQPPPEEPPPANGKGRPLNVQERAYFEPRFGRAFADVRVHQDAQAQAAAQALQARAFTAGNHIIFARNQYHPDSSAGRRLLAHELAHINGRHVPHILWRQDHTSEPAPADVRVVRPIPDADVRIEYPHSGGTARIIVANGVEWASVSWDAARGDEISISIVSAESHDDGGGLTGLAYGLRISASFPIEIHLNRGVEDNRIGSLATLFSYDFRGSGHVNVGEEQLPLPYRVREFYPPLRSIEDRRIIIPPDPDRLDPFGPLSGLDDARQQQQREERVENFVAGHPSFDSWQEMEAYIREHADQLFLGMLLPDGRFVARRITEMDLQRLAEAVRRGELEPEAVPYAGSQPEFFTITGLYIRGRTIAMHNLRSIADEYYREPFDAYMGYGDTVGREAEVYRVGDASYGRKTLSHSEALQRWRELDAYNARTIRTVQTLPGRRFHSLWVRTPREIAELDERYFTGRDAFYQNIGRINELATSQFGADLLVGRRLADPASALTFFFNERGDLEADIRYFLNAELYREQEDPRFRETLTRNEPVAAALAAHLYRYAEDRARHLVLQAIDNAIEHVQPLVDNRDLLREFVRQLPSANAERRRELLESIGVPENDRGHVAQVLSDARRAARVIYGHTETQSTTYVGEPEMIDTPGGGMRTYTPRYTHTTEVSLDQLHEWASDHLEGLQEFREEINSRALDPLATSGDFGNQVRERVYRMMGFTALHPEDFPHDNATTEFMPGPLASATFHFDTIAEQLFANHAARNEDVEFVRLIGKITLAVIGTVILALISGGIATAVVGYFGLTGLLAAVVEVGVAALSFTVLSELAHLLITGEFQSDDPGEFLRSLGINALMFGVFRALQPVMQATSRALVSSRGLLGSSIRSTMGARAGMHIAHGAQEFTAFLAFGIGNHMLQHRRLPQNAREWFTLIYESALTAVLMRVGSILARPVMEEIAIDMRSRRLGDLREPLEQYEGEAMAFEQELQNLLTSRPHRMAAEGQSMAERAARLIEMRRSLVERLNQRFRTHGDARATERQAQALEAAAELLQVINQLGGLASLRIRPVGEGGTVYTYEPNPQALEQLRAIYGEGNVSVDAEGRVSIRVQAGEVVELTYLPESLAGEAETLATQQLGLTERLRALGERADTFAIDSDALRAVRGTEPPGGGRRSGGLRPGARRTAESIAEAERLIGEAEAALQAEIQRMALQSYRLFRSVPERARALQEAREGELASLTDAQVGEAVHLFVYRSRPRSGAPVERVRTIYELDAYALRGVLFAYRAGVDLPRLRGRVRNFTNARRNLALRMYAEMMEARIEGATDVLKEMMQSNNKFEGGEYAMRYIRSEIGYRNVARMERAELNPNRIVDVILRDGTRIELKAWDHWQHGSLEWQFEKDVFEVCGRDFSSPEAVQRLRYVFRPPAPMEVAEIRGRLRSRLENMLEREQAAADVRQRMLSEFDLHTEMVEEGRITREGAHHPPPPAVSEPPPRPPHEEDDETAEPDVDVPLPQPKRLNVSHPGDCFEREADAMADRVMQVNGSALSPIHRIGGPQAVQRRPASEGNTSVSAGNDRVPGYGQALAHAERSFFEARFGQNFSDVRVHTDAAADHAAQALQAHAYTSGQHIVFARNAYQPSTLQGRHLLAHELTHVVQQQNLWQAPYVQRQLRTPQSESDWVNTVDARLRVLYGLSGAQLTPARVRFLGHDEFNTAFLAGGTRDSLENILLGIFWSAEFENYAQNKPYQILEHNHLLHTRDTAGGLGRIRRFVQAGITANQFTGRSREWLIHCVPRGGECRSDPQDAYTITPEQLLAESVDGFTTDSTRRADRRVGIRAAGGSFSLHTLVHEAVHFYAHPRFSELATNRSDGNEFLFDAGISQILLEGFTEYFTRRLLAEDPGLFGGGEAYAGEHGAAARLINSIGESEAQQAYFHGNRRQLQRVGWAIDWYKRSPELLVPGFVLSGPPTD